jgi:hypothetical protein
MVIETALAAITSELDKAIVPTRNFCLFAIVHDEVQNPICFLLISKRALIGQALLSLLWRSLTTI